MKVRDLVVASVVFASLLAMPSASSSQSDPFGNHGTPNGAATGDGPAFQSVAGSSEANLYTGVAGTRIDIVVPPGRAKMTPKVSIEYSSAAGRSALGYGWSVPTSRIKRSTKNGVPRFKDSGPDADVFVLDLNGSSTELISDTGNLYKPRIEGSFLKIGYDPDTNYWKVVDRDGITYIFGESPEWRLGRSTTTASGTSAWLLKRVEDFNGNTIEYTYTQPNGWPRAAGLLKQIDYGGHRDGLPAHQHKVVLTWDELVEGANYPTKAPVSYGEGFEQYSNDRLRKVGTYSNWHYAGEGGSPDLVREYDFQHEVDDLTSNPQGLPGSGTGISTLIGVGLTAYGMNQEDVTIPPSTFTYSPVVPFVCSTNQSKSCSSNADCGTGACDVRGGWQYGSEFWNTIPKTDAPEEKSGRFRDRTGDDGKAKFDSIDLNKDGIVDYIDANPPGGDSNLVTVRWGAVAADGSPSLGEPTEWSWPQGPGRVDPLTQQINESNGELRVSIFDLTGDGLPELVDTNFARCAEACGQIGTDLWCFYPIVKDQFGWPSGFDSAPVCWLPPVDGVGETIEGIQIRSSGKVISDTIDFDGDGRPDVLSANYLQSGWSYSENNGNGFNPPVTFQLPTTFFEHLQIAATDFIPVTSDNDDLQWSLIDINGDGLRDLVIPQDGLNSTGSRLDKEASWRVFFNQGGFRRVPIGLTFGNHFTWKVESESVQFGLPERTRLLSTEGGATISDLVDMTGDGLPDLIRRHAEGTVNIPGIPYRCDGVAGGPDLNSDGKSLSQTACWNMLVYPNTGSSFAPPIAWRSPANAVRADYDNCIDSGSQLGGCYDLIDFNGDGLIDLVANAWGDGSVPYRWGFIRHPSSPFISQNDDRTKPNLLLSTMNGLGAETHLEYVPLTYLEDLAVPFPYWVIRRIARRDIHSQVEPHTLYGYRTAVFDEKDREFRGFGAVRAVDRLGLSTITEFNQDDRRKGTASRKTTLGAIDPSCANECTPEEPPCSTICDPLHYILAVEEFNWGDAATYEEYALDPTPEAILKNWERVTPYKPGTAGSPPTPVYGMARETSYTYYDDGTGNEWTRTISTWNESTQSFVGYSSTVKSYFDSWSNGATDMSFTWLPSRPGHSKTTDLRSGKSLVEMKYKYYDGDAASLGSGKVSEASSCQKWSGNECDQFGWSTSFFGYDKWGNLVSETSPINGVTRFKYVGSKHQYVSEITDAANLKTFPQFDSGIGKGIASTNPNGLTVYRRYDGFGRPTTMWSNAGPVADEYGTVIATFSEADPQEIFTYTNPTATTPGSVAHAVWANLQQLKEPPTVTFYDGFGRILAVKSTLETQGGAEETTISELRQYNLAGQLESKAVTFASAELDINVLGAGDVIANAPAISEFFYDQHGRLIVEEQPNDAVLVHLVDEPGRKVTLDPVMMNTGDGEPGLATIELMDAMGRKTSEIACSAMPIAPYDNCPTSGSAITRTDFTYDALDRVTKMEQWEDPTSISSKITLRETTYDGLGKVIETTDQDAGATDGGPGVTTYDYDRAGNVKFISRPNESWTSNKYDRAGRLRQSKSAAQYQVGGQIAEIETTSFKVRYGRRARDRNAGLVSRVDTKVEHVNGNRISIRKEFSYDILGNQIAEERRTRADDYGDTELTMFYEYDEASRLVAVTYPALDYSGQGTDLGVTTAVATWNFYGQAKTLYGGGKHLVLDVEYNLYGQITHVEYGNGVHDFASYLPPEQNLRLSCLRTTSTADGGGCTATNANTDFQALSYSGYDDAGRVTGITDALADPGAVTGNTQEFWYDSLGRLTKARYNNNQTTEEEFVYDSLGNLELGGLGGTTSYQYTASQPHRLTGFAGVGLTYDANGNRRTKGTKYYVYDALDRLVEAGEGGNVNEANVYDEAGSRVVRSTDEVRHTYGGGLVEVGETDLVRYYYLGGRRVAMDRETVPSDLWSNVPAATLAGPGGDAKRRERAAAQARNQAKDAHGTQVRAGTVAFLGMLFASGALLVAAASRRGRVATIAATLVIASLVPTPYSLFPGVRVAHAAGPTGTFYFHTDHLGSTQVLTSQAGAASESLRYRAFGQTRCVDEACTTAGSAGVPTVTRTFTGHENDDEAGLIYMGARHYDPEVGGFLTVDPAEQFASPYLYTGGDPVNLTDPTGAKAEFWQFAAAIHGSFDAISFADSMIQTGGDLGASSRPQLCQASRFSSADSERS